MRITSKVSAQAAGRSTPHPDLPSGEEDKRWQPLRRAGFHTLHEGAADSAVPSPVPTRKVGTGEGMAHKARAIPSHGSKKTTTGNVTRKFVNLPCKVTLLTFPYNPLYGSKEKTKRRGRPRLNDTPITPSSLREGGPRREPLRCLMWFKTPTTPHYLMIRYSLGIRDFGLVGVRKNLLFYNLCVIFSLIRVFLPSSFLIFATLKGKNRVSN